MQNREDVEWTNCWWSKANAGVHRILLVGDSVIRRVRGELEKFMEGQYGVDLFAASLSIDDDLFWNHIHLFMNTVEYKYECIIVQYGFHHGFYKKCASLEIDKHDYALWYLQLLELMKKHCPNIVLMTGNSEVYTDRPYILNAEKEREITCRNSIAKRAAEKTGCCIFDMYTLMHEVENDYKYVDAQHYEAGADLYIAYEIFCFLIQNCLVCSDGIIDIKKKHMELFCERFGNRKNVVIYGTGTNGKQLYLLLKKYLFKMENIQFVESDIDGEKWCLRQKVKRINEISMEEKSKAVLIMSSPGNYQEMKRKADDLKFNYIVCYEDLIDLFRILQ